MSIRWPLPFLLLAACSTVPDRQPGVSGRVGLPEVHVMGNAMPPVERAAWDADPDPDAKLSELIAQGRFRLRTAESTPLSPLAASSYSLRTRDARLQTARSREQAVEIYVFSMGQADAMLVVGPPPERRTLLVDVGETNWNSRRGCLHVRERVKDITGQYRVDYLVLTHYHQDHAGGPPGALDGKKDFEGGGIFCLMGSTPDFFSVGTFIDSGAPSELYLPGGSRSLQGIRNLAHGWVTSGTLGRRQTAQHGNAQIQLGDGIEVEILVTNGQVAGTSPEVHAGVEERHPGTYSPGQQASPNDFSVGMEISVGEFQLFTAGDLTGAPENDQDADFAVTQHHQVYTNIEGPLAKLWRQQRRPSQVEVYRASHHGSGNSTTEELIDLLRPQLVIYSVGGKYGHPSDSVLIKAQQLGADQLITTRADRGDGTIREEYGNGWENPAGEIRIIVPVGGTEYTVHTDTQAFTYPVHGQQTQ